MIARLLLVNVMLLLAVNGHLFADPIDPGSIERMFAERNEGIAIRLQPDDPGQLALLGELTLAQRNALALSAAKALGVIPIGATTAADPSATNLVATADQRGWAVNWKAAWLICRMADARMVSDPAVIPYLVAGLDHPNPAVGQQCFSALHHLTRHDSGRLYWSRLVGNEAERDQISTWWQSWWAANKDRHPVFDVELESMVKKQMLDLAKRIETALKPRFPELGLYVAPSNLSLSWHAPIFHIAYDPSRMANPWAVHVSRDTLPWFAISCQLQYPDLGPGHVGASTTLPSPPKDLADQVTTVYTNRPAGTDLIINVVLATRNPDLISAMRQQLRAHTNTVAHQSGAGGGSTRQGRD